MPSRDTEIKKIVILAYPDNPVGKVFFETFMKYDVPISAIVVETMDTEENRGRLFEKVKKDGVLETLRRIFSILSMKLRGATIVQLAREQAVPVFEVAQFNSPETIASLEKLKPDLLCIASAPILKAAVFKTATQGCLNAHPGWLPAYRGIGANAHALMQGQAPGVSVHFIDAAIDQGALLKRERVPFNKKDTVAKINDRAVARGAEMMCETILELAASSISPIDINDEVLGPVYRALPYQEVKKVNRQIRQSGGKDAL